jgi:hypothetical protein
MWKVLEGETLTLRGWLSCSTEGELAGGRGAVTGDVMMMMMMIIIIII